MLLKYEKDYLDYCLAPTQRDVPSSSSFKTRAVELIHFGDVSGDSVRSL